MIITRKKKIPSHWLFYVQLPLVLSIYGNFVINAPFLFMMKRFIDNPAAIMGLISIEFYVTWLGGPFISWLSDRIWTRFGRRKFFFVIADAGKGLILLLMPFAPNLWALIILRWLYGAVGDFGAMTQALIYETVPPPQRGKASGIFSSCMQFGNLVFFFLLLGRFDDLYFMGPFAKVMELNGGAIMFWLAAFLLMGIAMFEGLGFKEIKPPDMKTLRDGRRPEESAVWYFIRNIFKDVFAKDFLPLYLFMFINVMFGVGLGVFRPLLFTEQWGYSLQQLGNTIAIGVVTTVTFSLISGWFADRYGKLRTFIIASVLAFIVNVFYTVYVYFQPDYRPSLTEVVVIGNVAAAIGMVKGVVTFPLMMEYVKRNRMGAANAGMGLFGALIRNLITLFVGVWLWWWSIWFFPQAGYHVEATFTNELNETQVRQLLSDNDISIENMVIRPVHQYGIDGDTSMRWWIHRNDERTQVLLKERKDINNELAPLETKLDSPLLKEEKRVEITEQIDTYHLRLDEITVELDGGVAALRQEVLPVLKDHLFLPGDQVLAADFEGHTLSLTLRTIEPLNPVLVPDLLRVLEGPQFSLIPNDDPESSSRWKADLQIELNGEDNPAITFTAGLDPRFYSLISSLLQGGEEVRSSTSLVNALMGIMRGEMGRETEAFQISNVNFQPGLGTTMISWDLSSPKTIQKNQLAELITEEKQVKICGIENLGPNKVRIHATLHQEKEKDDATARRRAARVSEVEGRLQTLLPSRTENVRIGAEAAIRFADALKSKPFYVTVPEHTPASDYRDREYEYFFSSQSLMIATDIIGFGIIWFLVVMEKKGVVHRAGAEEDENR